jgi:hypothetical protein
MRELVLGEFVGELTDRLIPEWHLAAALDLAGIGAEVGLIYAPANGSAQVIFSFHIFEIEGEPENVLVLKVWRR